MASGAAGGLNEGQWIGKSYSGYNFWFNVLTAVLQLFFVSRVLKYAGVRVALFILPAVALGGYTVLVFGAAIGLVRVVKIFEKSTDYSLQNTTRHVLFLPTSREVKYKAKAAIDTFFVRAGDFTSALIVFVGTAAALAVEQFAMINLAFIGLWIVLAIGVARRHRRLTAEAEPGLAAAQPRHPDWPRVVERGGEPLGCDLRQRAAEWTAGALAGLHRLGNSIRRSSGSARSTSLRACSPSRHSRDAIATENPSSPKRCSVPSA